MEVLLVKFRDLPNFSYLKPPISTHHNHFTFFNIWKNHVAVYLFSPWALIIVKHYQLIKKKKKRGRGTSLKVQWLRIRLPMWGTWVQSLVWEDSTCYRTTKACSTTREATTVKSLCAATKTQHSQQLINFLNFFLKRKKFSSM